MACDLAHEDDLRARGLHLVAGVDEAGRGPLAGPVVAAAVILPEGFRHGLLNDSKQLTGRRRDAIFAEITAHREIRWAFSVVESGEIDRLNILRATHEAMRRAVAQLDPQPQHVLIDGLPVRPFPIEQTALVGGDALSFSIAAASIIAKVTRDRLMLEHDARFPGYDFARHKGYGTPQHLSALKKHGPCPIHRRSFLPVRQAELGV
jgi:ribonuclease HII